MTFNGCTAFDTVTVTVDAPPTASNPATINVQCSGDVPAANVNVVTDEADDFTTPLAVTHVGDVSDGLTRPETITRTYSITDDCGNQMTATQTITFEDTTDPELAGVPADLTVECSNIPAPAMPTATDNCDIAPVVSYVEVVNSGSCPYTIDRTWTATDVCGNATSSTQTLTVTDTAACNFSDTIRKQVTVLSDSTWTLANDTICDSSFKQIGFLPSTNPLITYTWSPSLGLSDTSISNPVASPANTTRYQLLISNGI